MVMVRWNRLVVGSPSHQQRDVAEQTQLSRGTDGLTAPVYDGAGRSQERLPLLLAGKAPQHIGKYPPVGPTDQCRDFAHAAAALGYHHALGRRRPRIPPIPSGFGSTDRASA
jgi:hypothetical protein